MIPHHALWLMISGLPILAAANLATGQQAWQAAVDRLQQVGSHGAEHADAQSALTMLRGAPDSALETLLDGMRTDNLLAQNWLRGAIWAMWDRSRQAGAEGDAARLVKYIRDTSRPPAGRWLAYQVLQASTPDATETLKSEFLDDDCLELRRVSIEHAITVANDSLHRGARDASLAQLLAVLPRARDADQIEAVSSRLKEQGHEVDLTRQFGFITHWHLVGPFDHRDAAGFDVAYPPEAEQPPSLADTYAGRDGAVGWIAYRTEAPYGVVDLNQALGRHQGAIAYALVEFDAPESQRVEVRLGCINANKAWLNGKLLFAREVYHSAMEIDQYVGRGELRAGPNWILLKIAQNEQSESWAQRWEFQLRVCDAAGTPLRHHSRNPAPQDSRSDPSTAPDVDDHR